MFDKNIWFSLQVICWVLGEYGTADGKYDAAYITGKLCDIAEAYSGDETVKVSLKLFYVLAFVYLGIGISRHCLFLHVYICLPLEIITVCL